MTTAKHTKDCPTQRKPPRKPGACTCGVARDEWLRRYADLTRAMNQTRR